MTKPLVTVFFQTYNRPQLLIEGLESIHRQTFTDYDVIIFDNGSMPPVSPPLHIAADHRFRIIRNDDNAVGRAKIYQTICGIKTKYTAFLCDDDRWEDDKLARQIKILENDKNIVGCFTHAALINSTESFLEPQPGINNIFYQANRSQSEWVAHFFRYGNCLCHPSSVLRTSALKNSFNNSYCQVPDFSTWVNILAYGNIYIIQEPLTRFNCEHNIGRESAMDEAKTHRLLYENSRILHQFRKLPASVLAPAFGLSQDFNESSILGALFDTAHRCGTEQHLRFAAELAEEQLNLHIQQGDEEASAIWGQRYALASGKQPPQAPHADLHRGIDYYDRGNFKSALEAFSIHIKKHPECAEAHFYLALICVEMKMPEQIFALVNQALEFSPGHIEYLLLVGEACLKHQYPIIAQALFQLAIDRQPDRFVIYPLLAEAMRQNGQSDAAIGLLKSVVRFPIPEQPQLLTKLIDIQAQTGNLEAIAETCLQATQQIFYQRLGIHLLTRMDTPPEKIRQAQVDFRYRTLLVKPVFQRPPERKQRPVSIGFVLSDFQRGRQTFMLETLLRHLPFQDFQTVLIDNDDQTEDGESLNRCRILCDHYIPAMTLDDAALTDCLDQLSLEVLIDMDSAGGRNRLGAICRTDTPLKLSWSSLPPWELPSVAMLCGASLLPDQPSTLSDIRIIPLSGLGELIDLPAITPVFRPNVPARLACLSPALHVSQDSWHTFAAILQANENSQLVINLGALGATAQARIDGIFSHSGIDLSRLIYVCATTPESLCELWNEIDIGLAPLHGDGDDAMPSCLWMNTPYVALDNEAPWSHRPTALLRAAGLTQCIAVDAAHYVKIASMMISSPKALNTRASLIHAGLNNIQHFVSDFAASVLKAHSAP